MDETFTVFFHHIDPWLIFFYRLTGNALLDYFIGTLLLAFICVVLGELGVSLALRLNRRPIEAMATEMSRKEELSIAAYQAGDKDSYRALNKQATDVWGKHFFTMAAYSAGILCPIPFALGWMQTRFHDVAFKLAFPLNLVFGDSVGYLFTFIPLYILSRILFKYMRPWLPYFRGVHRQLTRYDQDRPPETC